MPIDIPPQPIAAAAPACSTMRVSGARVNLRAEPRIQHEIITKVLGGIVVTVLDCAGQTADGYTWWYVATGDGYEGWVAREFLDEATR